MVGQSIYLRSRQGGSQLLFFKKKTDTNFLALLIEGAEISLEAARVFHEAMTGDEPPSAYADRLRELEHRGDDITHRVYMGLAQVFVTPLDREDIITLATSIDDVTDGIEATIARFDYLNISVKDRIMKEFADVLVRMCEHMVESCKLLERKKYLDIREHSVAINNLENEGDRLMREGIRAIFTNPKDPYHDFRLKEIYERLEETTDSCEDVADILSSVQLKYS